jgi:hypothetical protein
MAQMLTLTRELLTHLIEKRRENLNSVASVVGPGEDSSWNSCEEKRSS